MKAEVPREQWSQLSVSVRGNLFEVSLNGRTLHEVEDATFTQPGRVGVWTKADSVMYFDDLTVVPR
jgi:hypothetical protein